MDVFSWALLATLMLYIFAGLVKRDDDDDDDFPGGGTAIVVTRLPARARHRYIVEH